MLNKPQWAIVKKDFSAIVDNKRYFSVLLIVPLLFSAIIPSLFIILSVLGSETDADTQELLRRLPMKFLANSAGNPLLHLMFNNILPLFFLLIPIMAASVMAASSFVGEKEKRTLETLLYVPLSIKQIFQAKVMAAFLVSMLVTLLSFIVMLILVEAELIFFTGKLLLPGLNWFFILLFLVPAVTLISIVLIVKGSAKSQTIEEAQQKSVFLVLPVIALVISQFTGIVFLSSWLLGVLSVVLLGVGLWLLSRSLGNFSYERLLK